MSNLRRPRPLVGSGNLEALGFKENNVGPADS